MGFRNSLRIRGDWDGATTVVIVEPWAREYPVASGEECELIALHPSTPVTFRVQPCAGGLIVCVVEPGSSYEFRRTDPAG